MTKMYIRSFSNFSDHFHDIFTLWSGQHIKFSTFLEVYVSVRRKTVSQFLSMVTDETSFRHCAKVGSIEHGSSCKGH